MFDRFMSGGRQRWPLSTGGALLQDWAPVADVVETEGEFLIKAELPEVRKEDIKVTVHEGVLSLTGERRKETRQEKDRFHRVERQYGSFTRRFSLPENVDETAIRAESKDGILTVHIPKQKVEEPKARQISVG
jgi:HSP20 family protein